MQIALKPEQENFIREKLQNGKYQSVDALLNFAFQLLEEHESKEGKIAEPQSQKEINEALRKEKFALSLAQLSYVSDEEQEDIEKHMNLSPNFDRSDYVDMTDWVRNEASLE